MLDFRAAVLRHQVPEQHDVALRARRPVGVASLGRRRDEATVDMVQQRLAKPRAGGDQRHVAAADGFAVLQHVQFITLQHRHRVGHRLEIVEQLDAWNREAMRNLARVDAERHVRQFRRVAEHRAGHAEAGSGQRWPSHCRIGHEGRDHLGETMEGGRLEAPHVHGVWSCGPCLEQPQQGLRAANVAGQDHDVCSVTRADASVDISRILHHLGGRPVPHRPRTRVSRAA